MTKLKTFSRNEAGGIAADWVVLTAAVAGLMFAALTVFLSGATGHADQTAAFIDAREIRGGR